MNSFKMINVNNKKITERLAIATGSISVGEEAFHLIKTKSLPKGDAVTLAEIAGIQGAKNAALTIPLCHPLSLEHIEIKTELNEENYSLQVYCKVIAQAKTGVEMEALSGVNSALLAIYDVTKMVNPNLQINNINLLLKIGGKSGVWINPTGVPAWVLELIPSKNNSLDGMYFSVVTLSDRASAGVYEDKSGNYIKEYLIAQGGSCINYKLIPDDKNILTETILSLSESQLIITTGGTGVSERDITPETIGAICHKMIPGIGELLRSNGAQFTPHSWSSRSCAGIYKNTLIISLPGSLKAVEQGMQVLTPLLPHIIKTVTNQCTYGL